MFGRWDFGARDAYRTGSLAAGGQVQNKVLRGRGPFTQGEEMSSDQRTFGEGNPQFDPNAFVDRRNPDNRRSTPGLERRQFANSYYGLTPDAAELGRAIDQYKLINRRRFITYEEMLS
ncbi:MAG: hypothetical protein AAF623_01525, partial [Planctomycetota bacterium]